jgi:hypothetical protein
MAVTSSGLLKSCSSEDVGGLAAASAGWISHPAVAVRRGANRQPSAKPRPGARGVAPTNPHHLAPRRYRDGGVHSKRKSCTCMYPYPSVRPVGTQRNHRTPSMHGANGQTHTYAPAVPASSCHRPPSEHLAYTYRHSGTRRRSLSRSLARPEPRAPYPMIELARVLYCLSSMHRHSTAQAARDPLGPDWLSSQSSLSRI